MSAFDEDTNLKSVNQPESLLKTMGLGNTKEGEETDDTVKPDRLSGFITDCFNRAELGKRKDEIRCLKAYQNFRGIYGSEVVFRQDEKSRVFIKITKTKVLAAYGQVIDVLFSASHFPISIEPSILPEGLVDSVHINPPNDTLEQDAETYQAPANDPYGYAGDGKLIPPGATYESLLGAVAPELKNAKVISGPGTFPGSITLEPAAIAAKKMQKKILDQLDKSSASEHLRFTVFECVLLGTGVMKGPLACDMEYDKWDKDGKYIPIKKTVPKLEAVSFWNVYPDPDASSKENADFIIERHKMTREMLRALKKRPFFRSDAIEACIEAGPKYTKKWWEDQIKDYPVNFNINRYEVFEFWGVIDKDIAEEAGIDIPEELQDQDELQINAWVCGEFILRVVLNPFIPKRIPYYIVPYELNPYTIFGIGIGENMEDTQTLMNGFARLSVDNSVLSGNVLLEVDQNMLAPGQDMAITPGKIFRRTSGQAGQAITAINIPNIAQENLQMFDKFRELADESTGIPSYSHGQTGIGGVTRTASGMSMLMGAASGNIKTVVKNIDDFLLRPVGEAFFAFNQQFNFDKDLNYELDVRARGTDSLMQNEVRSQRLMTFLQTVSNPMTAPFAKMPYIVREIAKSLDLDEDKCTNNPEEAQLQAYTMQAMGSMPTPGAPSGGSTGTPGQGTPPAQGKAPPGANVSDPAGSGGGQTNPGNAAQPGTPGFSANTGAGQQ